MPNHTANIVSIIGPAEDILAFIAKAKSVESALDFNNFVPMPKELEGTCSPVTIKTQKEIKNSKDFNAITQETYDELVKNFGFADWYSWQSANWGVKWGAYEVGTWAISNKGDNADIYFETAWAPAIKFWEKVAEQYPNLTFKNEYADEGGSFIGFTTFSGTNSDEVEYDWDSEDGIKLRKRLNRYSDEENEEIAE